MRRGAEKDTRIAYGAMCFWWGNIQDVGVLPVGLPCCPQCGGLLLEVPNEEKWFSEHEDYEKEHPGYIEFLRWSKGRCFKSREEAEAAYGKRIE